MCLKRLYIQDWIRNECLQLLACTRDAFERLEAVLFSHWADEQPHNSILFIIPDAVRWQYVKYIIVYRCEFYLLIVKNRNLILCRLIIVVTTLVWWSILWLLSEFDRIYINVYVLNMCACLKCFCIYFIYYIYVSRKLQSQ